MDDLRLHLSRPDALLQLAFLGIISGFITGGIIVLFRVFVEGSQAALLQGYAENYEILSVEERFLFPIIGSILIALLFRYFSKGIRVLGVPRVIESMALHHGYLSLRSFFLQFFGAAIAIISGHSVGREGPIVFLGAASSSLLGQTLGLPNNSIRTLVACGTAAGIAASFDTPLAGVIFALEVVMMEYTMVSFLPVILAAGSATSVSIFVFGDEPSLVIQNFHQSTLAELPLVIILGVLAGIFSALFIHLIQTIANKTRHLNFPFKLVLAGFIAGSIAMIEPGMMGIGYDSLEQTLGGNVVLNTLLLLLFFKLLATVACIGLGIPGGVIGPALFLGACLGGVFALLVRLFFPELETNIGFYSLLGMGAVMGASLQAPLAALSAMMELTRTPGVIFPGMIAIVIANLTASVVFGKKSLFILMLESNGIDISTNPITQTLRRTGVGSLMNKSIIEMELFTDADKTKDIIAKNSEWLLIKNNNDDEFDNIIATKELAGLLAQGTEEENKELKPQQQTETHDHSIDLSMVLNSSLSNTIPAAPIHLQATLKEALDKMNDLNLDVLYIKRVVAPGIIRIYGIVTREQIEASYL